VLFVRIGSMVGSEQGMAAAFLFAGEAERDGPGNANPSPERIPYSITQTALPLPPPEELRPISQRRRVWVGVKPPQSVDDEKG
jgi:hypothetical protein